MKIIYDNTIFNLQKYGGISRYFSEIISRIRKYENTQIYLARGLKGKLARINRILMDYRINIGKFDIYHPTYYSYAVRKRKHVKTVVTVYDMIHELYLFKMDNFKHDILMKRESIMSADHITCISNNTKKDLQKIYNIDDKLISVIYLGSPIKINDKELEDKYIVLSKPYLLYVGKRMTYKNFAVLLKAFHLLHMQTDFDIVCFGGGNFSKEEMFEFKRLQLENSIKYIDGPDELLQFYYKHATAFVYPSLYEGFGLSILEAMTFGCPVIASNAGSIPEITNNAALLFSPQSIEELRNYIKAIINDSQMRNSYIEKGYKRCRDFSWEKTVEATIKVYQKVLNQ